MAHLLSVLIGALIRAPIGVAPLVHTRSAGRESTALSTSLIAALITAPMGVAPLMHTRSAGREWDALLTALIGALIRAPMGIGCLIDGFNMRFNEGANGNWMPY